MTVSVFGKIRDNPWLGFLRPEREPNWDLNRGKPALLSTSKECSFHEACSPQRLCDDIADIGNW
jgi:hypothetical protein